ncbi:MAG: YicC family protein [bacterium]|nr:YicC family protein [bacterium]
MIQSMTGYGRAEVSNERLHLTVEVRSVNHRYLDVSLRYPRLYAPLESRLKRLVSNHFARGRIEIKFVEQRNDEGHWDLSLDYALAQQYYHAVQVLQERLDMPGAISFSTILNLREVVHLEEASEDIEEDWELIAQGLENALQALEQMRLQEGAFLYRDLQTRLQTITRHITTIRQRVPHVVTIYRQRLEQRVQELFQQFELDTDRLSQEAILFAERSDVTEELIRLESHMQAFERLLSAPEAVGRKIEFLVQEMHREVNTLATKSNDADISQHAVEVKSEFERIREQIQNIE